LIASFKTLRKIWKGEEILEFYGYADAANNPHEWYREEYKELQKSRLKKNEL
jgi:hypothetical protein